MPIDLGDEPMKWCRVTWLLGCCLLTAGAVGVADGVLDTSFHAPDGYVLWDGGSGYDRGRDIALQHDGKIVVVGYMTNGVDNDLFVVRFDSNGVLDINFGVSGAYIYDGGIGDDLGLAIAVQSDGKIVVAGAHSNGVDDDILVLRLSVDGFPDPTFGSDGAFVYDSGYGGEGALDLRVQADGTAVIVGYSHDGADSDLLVVRLTTEGHLDATFGTDGMARLDVGGGHDSGLRLVVQPDNSIVVTGYSHNGSNHDILVARFDATGTLDQTFGDDGLVLLDGGDYDRGFGVGLDSQQRVLLTGLMTQPDAQDTDYDICVLRLDPNGVLDTSFGYDGIALYDGGNREECYDLVVQCDDSILLAGHSGYSSIGASDWNLVVLKYSPDGTLDTTFGSEGVYAYDPTENTEWGYGLALQTDGKIVVTGQVHNGSDDDVIVLRLENTLCDANEPNEPSLIYTAEDLNALAARPNDWDKHFKLMADIDLSGFTYDRAVIAPDVGGDGYTFPGASFTGVFDGNGHAVLNLTITGKSYLGLFGQVGPGGQVKNLGMVNVDMTGSYYAIGGLVGDNCRGNITACYSTGTVTGYTFVGGLVGYNNYGDIATSHSTCATSAVSSGNQAVGGLAGVSAGSITTSYSSGDVSGQRSVGGLVGWNYQSNITNSYSTGMVSGDQNIGGLVGKRDQDVGIVADCFWDTQTSGQATSAGGVGKTTTELRTAGTFLDAGWDFVDEAANGTSDIWWILEGQDYPRLWWQAAGN